jgi:zinc D-Ala-D-Ala carboxypeptidase
MADFFILEDPMTTHYFADWRDVPDKLWRWPDFSPEEIACRGDGKIQLNEPALDKLQVLRDQLGVPLIVHSAYRSPDYNRQVGGAQHSMHLQGAAFDISMANHDPENFEAAARDVGFTGFGFYLRQNFMHIDIGRARQWGDPFPPRATRGGRTTRFADEPPRLRESLTESRTMKGGGAAGVATIGAAGVEVAQQAVADTQSAIQPLIPYLDTLRWLFIVAALIGVGITIFARWDDWRKGKR